MKHQVTYRQALGKHSFDKRHVCVVVCSWGSAERQRREPTDVVARTLQQLHDLADDVRVVGAAVPGVAEPGVTMDVKHHYRVNLDDFDNPTRYLFWRGALSDEPYQPVFEISDTDALTSWIASACIDPRVSEDLATKTSPSAVEYCLDRAASPSDVCFVLYGGSLELGDLVVFAHSPKAQAMAEYWFDHCGRSERFALYASDRFEV